MAKSQKPNQEQEEFKAQRIDDYAVEVQPGLLQIEGVKGLVKKDEYLRRKGQELQDLCNEELRLRDQVRRQLSMRLGSKAGSLQEECRPLSWSYVLNTKQGEMAYIQGKGWHNLLCRESKVQAYHLQHQIQAYLALCVHGLGPEPVGKTTLKLSWADTQEQALHNRTACWKYLLSLIPQQDSLNSEAQQRPRPSPVKTNGDELVPLLKEVRDLLKQLLGGQHAETLQHSSGSGADEGQSPAPIQGAQTDPEGQKPIRPRKRR